MKTYLLKAGVRQAIAKAGETDIVVAYNAKTWVDEYPAGNPQLMVTTPGGKRVPVTVEAVDNLITGQVPNELLAGPGVYSYVFVWTSGSTQLESGRCECLVLGSNLANDLVHDSRRTPEWAERIFLAAEVIERSIDGAVEARNMAADKAAEAETHRTAAETAKEGAEAAEQRAIEVRNSIPETYTELSDKVDNLKTAIGQTPMGTTATSVTGAIAEHGTAIASESTRITAVENNKVNMPATSPNGTNGQLLRTNGDGTTVWVDQGLPTDAQTAMAIAEWLADHPEATTTVEDESIGYEKLIKNTLGFVIPEMYGAFGDGDHDDTEAINKALAASNCVVLLGKIYKTTGPVYVPSYTTLMGIDKYKSKIYNVGTGYMKNAVICGHIGGDSASNGIIKQTAIAFTKITDYTFSCEREFAADAIIHFKVAANDNGTSQALSTSTYIISADNGTYTTADPIPDDATLYAYDDIVATSGAILEQYVAFGTRVENLTIEHLPTGSGMYCLFLCGARQTVKNIRTIGNTGLASNLSVHNVWENIECISYSDNLDCAEYVYNTLYKNISVEKSSIKADTEHTQLAFGRGHDIKVDHFTSNVKNDLALAYAVNVDFEDCELYLSNIMTTDTTSNVMMKRCKLYSDAIIALNGLAYIDCYIQKPAVTNNKGYFDNVVSDYAELSLLSAGYIHKPDYKKYLFEKVYGSSLTNYSVVMFDNAIMVTARGSNLMVSNGSGTTGGSATKLELFVQTSGNVRIALDGGAFIAPGWTPSQSFTISGSIASIENKSMIRHAPAISFS